MTNVYNSVPRHHRETITTAFNQNKTDAQIARLTGLGEKTVAVYRGRLGLSRQPGRTAQIATEKFTQPERKIWPKAPDGYARNKQTGGLLPIMTAEQVFHAHRDANNLPPKKFSQIRRIEVF